MTLRAFAAAALVSVALSALAEGMAPPANGTGKVTFMHGDIAAELPLNQIEITQISRDPLLQLVSLDFVDARNENRFQLSFSTQGKAGGTASCAPMFEMDATTSAKPVTAIKFSARLN
jgi:hypothetical protein